MNCACKVKKKTIFKGKKQEKSLELIIFYKKNNISLIPQHFDLTLFISS